MNYFSHYVNAGFSVLPIKTDGSKSPAIGSWARYQLDKASHLECDDWHAHGLGVAIIGGIVSGGLEIIDIDDPALARPFFEALREADEMLANKLAWVATPRRDPETGKSGVHVMYRCEKPVGNQKLAMSEPLPQFDAEGNQQLNPVTGDPIFKPETLIETRGEGGYVVTVGSPAACHPSGNQYEHKYGCQITELEKISDGERSLLLRVASHFDRSVTTKHEQLTFERDRESPGNKFAAENSWEQILEPHGWTKVGPAGKTQRWCRPGKTKGWSATTGLVSTHGADLFCVFSSNAHPFPGPASGSNCSTHSKFDAYARLNFGGDHSAAAKHLAGEGYGKASRSSSADTHAAKPIVFETWDRVTRQYLIKLEQGLDQTISLPLPSLQDSIGGLAFGEVAIIAGRPSHGKTLVALQFADHFSTIGYSPLILSEEMSLPMLSKRRLHMATDIAEEHWHTRVNAVAQDYSSFAKDRAHVYIAPQCGTVKRAIEVIEKAASDHELKIVVIDYAQLLRGKGNTRYEQVTDVSQQIREITSKHGLLTLLLCQLNRGSERAEARPRSVDLRDSGQLEQDADVVMLVDWPYRRGVKDGRWDDYTIYVDKNRNREIRNGEVKLKINPRRQMIEERTLDHPAHEWNPNMDYEEVTGNETY